MSTRYPCEKEAPEELAHAENDDAAILRQNHADVCSAAAHVAIMALPPDCSRSIVSSLGTICALRLVCTCKFFRCWSDHIEGITFDLVEQPKQRISFHGEKMAGTQPAGAAQRSACLA